MMLLESHYLQNFAQGFGLWNADFGGFHTGVDIMTAHDNPPVYALADGEVVWNCTESEKYTSDYTKYFNAFVIVNHGNFYAYYGHLKSTLKIGDSVSKGNSIGIIRDAYNSENVLNRDNNHLHLSISTGDDWIQQGWGYQKTQDGLKQFIDPKSYVGL
jgi:murein DD-endopeptidase MepM/ murein hydrolase activator NlpD